MIYCAHENGFHAGIQVTELYVQEGFFVGQEVHFQHGKNNRAAGLITYTNALFIT